MDGGRKLSETIQSGDLRLSLEAVRDQLADALEVAEPREAAAVARQLTAVLEKLSKLPGSGEVTPLDRIASSVTDELAARRADRQPDSAGSSRAGGRSEAGS